MMTADKYTRLVLAFVFLGMIASGCATTNMKDDPLRNTKKLVTEGHASLYQNGAFRVPNTSISLIPPGPSTLEFVRELAGMRARQSFETSIMNAADSVYIVSEGAKITYDLAKNINSAGNAGAGEIRKYTRENSTLLVYRSTDLGKNIVGKSWDLSKTLLHGGAGDAIVQGSRSLGNAVSEKGTTQGTGLASGSIQAARDVVSSSASGGNTISESGTKQGMELSSGSVQAAKDISASSTKRSGSALKYAGNSFVEGYAAVPAQMKKRTGEMGESLSDAKFASIAANANNTRKEWSQKTVDLMSDTAKNYPTNVSDSFNKAGKELEACRTTGVSFAVLKSLRWVLQGVLWDATIQPLTKMTAASVGYIGVNCLAFPSMVVVAEGAATAKLAVQVTWDAAKMGYDLVAPTGVAAVAGVYGLLDFTGSHAVAGATAVGGTVAGYGEAGLSKAAGVAIKGGGYAAAGATAVGGTVVGYSEAGLSKVAGVVIKGSGFAAGKGVQYIGVPLASAGIVVGGGAIGTAVGTVGTVSGGTLFVGGEVSSATTQVFGNVIAGTALVGGTAVSTAGGAAYGVYELSKAVVVPAGYELGGGMVLSYETLSHIAAHSILAVSDCAYLVLSLEGPRWVLYAVKGRTGTGDDLPPGAVVDLKKMQGAGEEIYYLPVSDEEMKDVVNSVYDTLPEIKAGHEAKAAEQKEVK
jgi:hypothetical protein